MLRDGDRGMVGKNAERTGKEKGMQVHIERGGGRGGKEEEKEKKRIVHSTGTGFQSAHKCLLQSFKVGIR